MKNNNKNPPPTRQRQPEAEPQFAQDRRTLKREGASPHVAQCCAVPSPTVSGRDTPAGCTHRAGGRSAPWAAPLPAGPSLPSAGPAPSSSAPPPRGPAASSTQRSFRGPGGDTGAVAEEGPVEPRTHPSCGCEAVALLPAAPGLPGFGVSFLPCPGACLPGSEKATAALLLCPAGQGLLPSLAGQAAMPASAPTL